jgi:hypothetical protein
VIQPQGKLQAGFRAAQIILQQGIFAVLQQLSGENDCLLFIA